MPNPRPVPESSKESPQELGNHGYISDHIDILEVMFVFTCFAFSLPFSHVKTGTFTVSLCFTVSVQEVAEKAAQDPPSEVQATVPTPATGTEKPAAKETKETKEVNEVKAEDWEVAGCRWKAMVHI